MTWLRRETDVAWFGGFGDDPGIQRQMLDGLCRAWPEGEETALVSSAFSLLSNAGWNRRDAGAPEKRENMEKQPQNVQDGFLNSARKEKTLVTVYLLSGVKLTGRIRSFDKYSVILESNNQEQMIFKHAIATVVLPRPSNGAPGRPRKDKAFLREGFRAGLLGRLGTPAARQAGPQSPDAERVAPQNSGS